MYALHIWTMVLSFISLLLLLISLCTDYWVNVTDAHSGLWRACYKFMCGTIVSNSDKLNAIRAFMLIGMIAGAVAFFGLWVSFCKSHIGSISLAKISAIASLAAGLSAMIAMVIFTAFSNGFGWSFFLGWASVLLFLITSGITVQFQRSESFKYNRAQTESEKVQTELGGNHSV